MVESLRRWGGAFADAPVIAITPRYGPRLSPVTLAGFKKLGVHYSYHPAKTPYTWFQYYNKPLCLAYAETIANTETIGWLDSDILFVGEPTAFRLEDGLEFTACPSEKDMGSCGEYDPFESLWRTACLVLDIDIESLPWIISEPDGCRIRLYWNGGVFIYRRLTRFGNQYLNVCKRLMEAQNRTTSGEFSVYFNEMSAIGFAMYLLGLKWRPLPYSHNYSINWRSHARIYRENEFRAARVVHYHDSMSARFWNQFIDCLYSSHPSVAQWLSDAGPLRNRASRVNRLTSKLLKTLRGRKEREYMHSCRVV
jgi:hypothetical protein